MRARNTIIILSGLITSLSLNKCTGDYEKINTNQLVLADIDRGTVGNVFASAEYHGLLYDLFWPGSWQVSENLFADLYAQYYSNRAQGFQTDRHGINLDWLDIAWDGFWLYSAKDLEVVLQKTRELGMKKEHSIAQIYKVLVYQRITDYWGPIPYFSVNNGQKIVPYESQESIYRDFFVKLDSATTVLSGYHGENGFGANDQIYGGVVDNWIIFANTLRLRIAMRISNVDPVKAKTEAEKAVNDGVMESNDENALLKVTISSVNPVIEMLPWNEFRMSATMESILKGFGDPRLQVYWSPAVNTGLFTGIRNGLSVTEMSTDERSADNLSTMGPRWNEYSNRDKTPWEVMQASEAWFLKAEGALKGWNMGVTAEEAYYRGIETSLKYWGATDEQIADYKAGTTTPVALSDFNTPPQSNISVIWSADPLRHLEQIMTQKWIALFPDGWEAWSENRRTEYPVMYPVLHSENPDVPEDELMRRVPYPTVEYNKNDSALKEGIVKLDGPDKASTRLWWNVAK
jgi:hypothetical protein